MNNLEKYDLPTRSNTDGLADRKIGSNTEGGSILPFYTYFLITILQLVFCPVRIDVLD